MSLLQECAFYVQLSIESEKLSKAETLVAEKEEEIRHLGDQLQEKNKLVGKLSRESEENEKSREELAQEAENLRKKIQDGEQSVSDDVTCARESRIRNFVSYCVVVVKL